MRNTLYLILITTLFHPSCETGDERSSPRGRTVEPTHTAVIISEQDNEPITEVKVALARTNDERSAGLMHVYNLPFDTGMYFIFENEAQRSFWMVNTPLSLDILFMNSAHEIVRIHTHTVPFSDRSIRSDYPAQYVLEVNAGFVDEYGIHEGMLVILKE